MLDRLTLLAFAPLLLVQGAHVRRVTPRLPEPDGERAGCLGAGPPLRLLIVGDSAAAGVGVAHQAEALSDQLIARLARRHRLDWRLLARSGATTAEIRALLDTLLPAERFDVALVSAGVNDVTARTSPAAWLRSIDALVAALRTRGGVRHVVLTRLPPMHRFPALPQPLRTYLGARAQRYNAALAGHVARRADCSLLATDFAGRDDAIAADGFHPGPIAYALWAEAAAEHLLALVPPA